MAYHLYFPDLDMIVLFLLKIISHTPFFILYSISTFLSFILTLLPCTKYVAKRNFYRVFVNKSNLQLNTLTFKFFRNFIDYFIEMIKLSNFSEDQMKKHCKFNNIELIEHLVNEHQFVLCFGAHMVNYEMMTSFPLHSKSIGMCHLYLAAPPSKALNWVLNLRGKYGAINIPTNNPIRPILELRNRIKNGEDKHKGYVWGSLSDMDPKRDDHHSVPFLNHKLEVKTGAEKLARKLNMGFCYAHMKKIKRGYYEVTFKEMIPRKDPAEYEFAYTDEFVRLLEINIKEQPEIWMQWGGYRF